MTRFLDTHIQLILGVLLVLAALAFGAWTDLDPRLVDTALGGGLGLAGYGTARLVTDKQPPTG